MKKIELTLVSNDSDFNEFIIKDAETNDILQIKTLNINDSVVIDVRDDFNGFLIQTHDIVYPFDFTSASVE